MKIYPVESNRQWLDGGAMFGNAPKGLWNLWMKADDKNCIELATRALLIELESGKTILFDAGVGNFFSPKQKERFGVVGNSHRLIEELERLNRPHDTIDYVILSHLHFDHAGGVLDSYQEGVSPKLLFPKAKIFVGEDHFARAFKPHIRDRVSFIPELPQLLIDSNRLTLVKREEKFLIDERFKLSFLDGHTPGLMVLKIEEKNRSIYGVTDLIPGIPWVHLPITMGYDRFPEKLVEEKGQILENIAGSNDLLFFAHDPKTVFAKVVKTEGKYLAVPCSIDSQF